MRHGRRERRHRLAPSTLNTAGPPCRRRHRSTSQKGMVRMILHRDTHKREKKHLSR
uniref:Uncharacterized protein n=1 Tax=Physcomitrium patens TaxID=3218 RepID=A0A2K1KGU0_PHYPA|nr:hypothetical protein PHYPA_009377 [Physcomitrium patens]